MNPWLVQVAAASIPYRPNVLRVPQSLQHYSEGLMKFRPQRPFMGFAFALFGCSGDAQVQMLSAQNIIVLRDICARAFELPGVVHQFTKYRLRRERVQPVNLKDLPRRCLVEFPTVDPSTEINLSYSGHIAAAVVWGFELQR